MSMAAYGLGIVVAPVHRPHAGRLAHRYLQLALRLLHQHSRRHSGGHHDQPLRPRSALHQERQGRPIRQHRLRAADGLDRRLQIVLDKGQEDDWFGALWVRWAVAALVIALLLWIWRSWTNPKGLVDLHVLKDRNFRTGCFLIAMLGMCIYITIAILPLYYQEILGYTAFTAGLVVGPRGIGSFIGSPVIGILGSRIDNRKLLCGRLSRLRRLRLHLRHSQSRHRPLHAADPHHPHRLCAQLCLCSAVHHDDGHHSQQGDGQRHRPGQHAAQHRRVDWDFNGHHRPDSPRRAAPDLPGRQPHALHRGAAAEIQPPSPVTSATTSAPRRRAPAPSACSTA